MNLSRYFTLDELIHSNTAKAEGIDNRPGAGEIMYLRALCTTLLDPLREAVGRPIKVNSGYRGPALNRRIGGAKHSQHLTGQAADIQSSGMSVLDLFKRVIQLKLPFDQIIYEVNGSAKWVHLSHNPGANRGEILLAKFGADGRVTYPRITAQQALDMSEPATRSIDSDAEPEYMESADEPEYEAPMARGLGDVAPARARTRSPKAPVSRKARAPKQAAPRRSATKETAARKTAARKATARKTTALNSAAKKGASGKARPKSTSSRKSAASAKRTAKAAEKRSAATGKGAARATVKRRAAAKPGKRSAAASRARRR